MKTARTVVIDEDRDEALTLLQALGRAGIGAVYISGDDDQLLPEQPLKGIRLVFLDLKLINLPEARQYLPVTVKVLKKSVHFEARATGIICWTKHNDEVAALQEELRQQGLQPAFVKAFENKLQITQGGSQGITALLGDLSRIIAEEPGRGLLVEWEQFTHDAATDGTESLLRMSSNDKTLLHILAAVAKATADDKITSHESAVGALFSGLAAVHSDALQGLVEELKPTGAAAAQLFDAVAQLLENKPTLEQRAKLNTVLLASAPGAQSTPQPGNVYLGNTWNPADQFPGLHHSDEIREFVCEVFGRRSNDPKSKTFADEVTNGAVACLLEITPACDHASGKCENARLLGGILICGPKREKDEKSLPAASRLFAKEVEFVWLDNQPSGLVGAWKLIVNARRLFSLPFAELKNQLPVFRLRHSVVSDIRAWFGSHAARPGYASLR